MKETYLPRTLMHCICVMLCLTLQGYSPAISTFNEALFALEVCAFAAGSIADDTIAPALKRLGLLKQADEYIDTAYPIRTHVRQAVETWPLDIRQVLLAFFSSANMFNTVLNIKMLENIGAPPYFSHAYVTDDTIKKLAQMLRYAYQTLPIQDLWQQEKANWQTHQPSEAYVTEISDNVNRYMRLSGSAADTKFTVLLNPLMQPWTGANASMPNHFQLLVYGPNIGASELMIAHELLHSKVEQHIMQDPSISSLLDASECYYHHLIEQSVDVWGYDNWRSYVIEGLVRMLSYRITNMPWVRSNIQFEEFLAAPLDDYEQEKISLIEALQKALYEASAG